MTIVRVGYQTLSDILWSDSKCDKLLLRPSIFVLFPLNLSVAVRLPLVSTDHSDFYNLRHRTIEQT